MTANQWQNYNQRRNVLALLPQRVQVLLVATWANNVLHLFEKEYPNDDRPRKAIEMAFDFALTGIVDKNAARDVASAAYATARAASYAWYCKTNLGKQKYWKFTNPC